MHRGLVALVVVSAGLACDRGSTGESPSAPAKEAVVAEAETPAAAGGDETPDAKGETKSVAAPSKAAGGEAKGEADSPKADPETPKDGPPPTLPEGPAGASPWEASIEGTVTLSDSKTLRVAAEAGDEQSIVWAQTVTADGTASGPPIKLRSTNGKIDSLDAAFDGTTLWVGWRAALDKDDRGLEGLAGFDLSLKQTVKTKTLRFFRYGSYYGEDELQLVARPGVGAGAVVVALSGAVRCEGMFVEEEGKVECAQFTVDVVGPDGSVEQTETAELEGGDPSFSVTPGDQGVAVEFVAWRGGAGTELLYVAYGGASESLSTCEVAMPPAMSRWVDGGLFSICPVLDTGEEELALSCSPSSPELCGVFFFQRPAGTKGTSKIPEKREVRFDRLALGCKNDELTLRVGWKGGHIDMPSEGLGFKDPAVTMKDGKCVGRSL